MKKVLLLSLLLPPMLFSEQTGYKKPNLEELPKKAGFFVGASAIVATWSYFALLLSASDDYKKSLLENFTIRFNKNFSELAFYTLLGGVIGCSVISDVNMAQRNSNFKWAKEVIKGENKCHNDYLYNAAFKLNNGEKQNFNKLVSIWFDDSEDKWEKCYKYYQEYNWNLQKARSILTFLKNNNYKKDVSPLLVELAEKEDVVLSAKDFIYDELLNPSEISSDA